MAHYAMGHVVDGRYEVCRLLGEGGTATVYRALDRGTGEVVVLKVPHLTWSGDMAVYRRFQRESNLGAELHHPGLQHVLSPLDERPGHVYAVLEYVDGVNLRTYLAQRGPLPVVEVVGIGEQLAEALGYLHGQGFVHRDVKPENVLITQDGRVKLLDFGLAQRLHARWLPLNHLALAAGTPEYMPPEQVRGEPGDERADVYALGVLLYELLVGQVPGQGMSAEPVADAATAPVLVRRQRTDAPPELEAILYRATRRRPAERYPTMAAFKADLCHLDHVQIPVYERDEPPTPAPGDLPPLALVARLLVALVGLLVVIGGLAEFVHRAAVAP